MADDFYQDGASGLDDAQGEIAPSAEDLEAQRQAESEAQEEAEKAQREQDEKDIDLARKCYEQSEEASRENRVEALEDIQFSLGKQWNADVQREREIDGRPCLTFNRLPQFIQQISNDQRQNRPAIKVHPVNDGANVETAEILQGLIRHVEYNSNADVAYDTGGESAIRGGFGAWRVVTDYVSPDSFDQDAYIKRVANQFSVHPDPSHQDPAGADMEWCHVTEDLTRDQFLEKWPDSKLASLSDWESIGNAPPDWMKSDAVRVSEYFYKEYQETLVHQLNTGESVLHEKLADKIQRAQAASIQAHVVRSRKTKVPKVKWFKHNAVEILERGEWAGKYIPIILTYGTEVFVNGKRMLSGVVRHARDPQRMLNFYKSAEAEAIALAPKAPFIGAEGQFEDHEEEWKTANRKNHAYLEYKPTTFANGQPAPPPERMAVEPAVQAITGGALRSADDLKASIGLYDQSLGAGPADQSGVAIQKRNVQAQTTVFHYTDNLNRSIRHTGRVLIDLFPHIYDTARTARIIGEDGAQKIVRLNQEYQDEDGEKLLYDLSVGTYDVTLDTGPSYASKRQETAAIFEKIAHAWPQFMQYAGDLFVGSLDVAKAPEIAERLKKMLPPQLQDEPGKGGQKIPPQVQAQMQQMSQMVDALTKELNAAQEDIRTKRIELESKERIEFAKIQTEAEIAMAKMGSQESMELLRHQVAEIETRQRNFLEFFQTISQPSPDQQSAQAEPAGQGAATPTGGPSPGQPVEGNP